MVAFGHADPAIPAGPLPVDDNASDEYRILATPATVTTTLSGQGGSDVFRHIFGDGGKYVVGPDQPTAGAVDQLKWAPLVPLLSAQFPQPGVSDIMNIDSVLGGTAVSWQCTGMVSGTEHLVSMDFSATCAKSGESRLTLFGLDPTASTVGPVIISGAFANPLGTFAPSTDAAMPYSWAPLFLHSVFPCGVGQVAFTVCPAQDAQSDTGAFVVASMEFQTPVPPTPGADAPTIALSAGGHTWTLAPAQGAWTLQSDQPTTARAIIYGGSVTFAIPQSEVGTDGFTYSVTRSGQAPAFGVLPMTGVLRTPPVLASGGPAPATTVPPAPEDLAGFVDQLSASIAAGDGGYAFDRLDPLVLQVFGADACHQNLGKPKAGFSLKYVATGERKAFTWSVPDGRSFTIADAQYATARVTDKGSTKDAEVHFSVIDGRYHWFTYCD